MDHIFEHYKKTGYLHHAHVIEGVHADVMPVLLAALERHLGINVNSNTDLMVEYHDSLGVNEAHAIKEMQTRAAFNGNRKFFIIGTESFTHEAQNALLKTLEEPTAGTYFFIIIPRREMILPTLLSRVLVVHGIFYSKEDETKALADKFLNASLPDRFAIAKKLADKKDRETVDRELFRRMFDHIERILYTRTAGKRDETTSDIFREIFKMKTYLANRGASPKMLLEHLAIVLPLI